MSIFDLAGGSRHADGPVEARCSRKGCRAPAGWQLLWNNPRIHTPERRKVWLACPDHSSWLEDYLQQRGLWKETLPFLPDQAEPPAGPGNHQTPGQDN